MDDEYRMVSASTSPADRGVPADSAATSVPDVNNSLSETREPGPESRAGWSSLAFWSCLFVAAGCYSLTVLGPKLLFAIELNERRGGNQRQLLELESRTRHWERLASAWKSDGGFNAATARSRYTPAPGDEQVISLPDGLKSDLGVAAERGGAGERGVASEQREPEGAAHAAKGRTSGNLRAMRGLLSRAEVRRGLLGVAGGLTVLAFTLFRGGL